MICNVDHIGVAVKAIEGRLPFWAEALGLQLSGTETVESEGVRVAFLPVGRTRIELLEPVGADSLMQRHLDRRGEGLHHIAFEVDDLDAAIARLREAGVEPVGGGARTGAGGCRVAFLHPKSTGGLLVELIERCADSDTDAVDDVVSGAAVLVYMRQPQEKMWGLLRRLDETGVTFDGIDLGSFDNWLAQLDGEDPVIGGPSLVFVPMGRVEKILLDQQSGAIPSLAQRVQRRSGRPWRDSFGKQ